MTGGESRILQSIETQPLPNIGRRDGACLRMHEQVPRKGRVCCGCNIYTAAIVPPSDRSVFV